MDSSFNLPLKELDAILGSANRAIEEAGFHWWMCYISNNASERPYLNIIVSMVTTKSTIIKKEIVVHFGDELTESSLRYKLHSAKESIEALAKRENLGLIKTTRPDRIPWKYSLPFAPSFFRR